MVKGGDMKGGRRGRKSGRWCKLM